MGRQIAMCLLLAVLTATARAEQPFDARVHALLAAGVESAVPVQAFADLGPEVVPALLRAFEQEDAPPFVRLRALATLAALDDARVDAVLVELVSQAALAAAEPPASKVPFVRSGLVLRRALSGLALRPAHLLPSARLVLLLQHHDPHVRERVAELLGTRRDGAAQSALEAQQQRERSALVRAALERALTGRSALRRGPRLVRPRSAPPPR